MFVKSLDIKKDIKVSELIEMFGESAFNARRLSIAAKIYEEMVSSGAHITLTLAGAMIPAGMRKIISGLIKNNFINCLVTTGANIVHEICEALGFRHLIGSLSVNDVELGKKGISRIYDVFIEQKAFEALEKFTSKLIESLNGRFASFEVLWAIGKMLPDDESFLKIAYNKRVPIICPTLHDSIIGLHMYIYGKNLHIDYSLDIKNLLDIYHEHEKNGIVIIGGGVPKNFALQAMLLEDGFDYAIQITTDVPEWGGLSGATLDEAKSWCKLKPDAKSVTVYCDATIALPMIYAYLLDKLK